MKLKDFMARMQTIAPKELAYSGDNVGLLVGPDHDEIKTVLVALDLSVETAEEAIQMGADLVLTHHPSLDTPVQRILPDHPETAAVYRLIRHGIGHFAAHTNLDSAKGGVNDVICDILGLHSVEAEPEEGLCRVGTLPEPITLRELYQKCVDAFGENTTFTGDPDKIISRVGVCGGAGGGTMMAVRAIGADALVTGESKHHHAIAAKDIGFGIITAGHYETEAPVLKALISRLQDGENDVQYRLTHLETSPFRRQ